MTDSIGIANRIKERRKEIRLKQKELADKLGVSIVTMTRWENPKSGRTPNSTMLPKIASALNTTVEYLMGIDGVSAENKTNVEESEKESFSYNMPENNLGLSYWGGVVDNASRVASRGNMEELSLVGSFLQMALNSIVSTHKVPLLNQFTGKPLVQMPAATA